MKIVGFELKRELRLGLLDRDEVVDLQAADPSFPSDLGELLRRTNGDTAILTSSASRGARDTLSKISSLHCR
jgi:acylpyruvate hydrolase